MLFSKKINKYFHFLSTNHRYLVNKELHIDISNLCLQFVHNLLTGHMTIFSLILLLFFGFFTLSAGHNNTSVFKYIDIHNVPGC